MTRGGREARGAARLAVRAAALAALALAAVAAASCGSRPPEVAAVEWRLEARPRAQGSGEAGASGAPAGGSYESLSAFGSIKDEEGMDNISEIWILNDEASFAWKLTDADWTKSSSGSDTWIGAAALATPELGSLPRGDYRLVAIDAAGSRAELGFSVSGDFPDRRPPSLSYERGSVRVGSAWPETLVLAFDAAGALLSSQPAPAQASGIETVFGKDLAQRTAALAAYGYDPALRMGSYSRRTTIR